MRMIILVFSLFIVGCGSLDSDPTIEVVEGPLGGPREMLDDANTGIFDGANYGQLNPGDGATLTPIPSATVNTSASIDKPVATATTIPPTPLPEFQFSDPVPQADSDQVTSEQAGACFSRWSHEQNFNNNLCLPEWFPKDQAPRLIDLYWCVSTDNGVEWVPVRFYQGGLSPVVPYGYPERCN